MKPWAIWGSAVALTLAAPALAQVVDTDSGSVRGSTVRGVASWKGIPFAAPPVGDLRWRAPQPVKPWRGVRPATAFSNDCMQIPFAGDAAPLGTPPAEDCLYVNVWRPATARAGAKLPVMVWIYGGGLVNGGASPAVYDGSEIARQGVILVSFNYRLGRFGFFAHPALSEANEDNGLLGNYGYLDQIAALRWVQRNVAAFGGDPNNVTVFGESAGGGSVNMLMTTPMARGLFQKAIVMSGGGRSRPMKPIRAEASAGESAERDGLGFARWAGVPGTGSGTLAELRALPAEKVVAGIGIGQKPVAPASGPMLDGMLLIAPPEQVYRAGNAAAVPFIAGANSADIGFGPADEPDVFARFGADAARARVAYRPLAGDPAAQRRAIFADAGMVEPARFMVQQMTRAGQPAWNYRAGYVPEVMRAEWKDGLPHATEIPFFFRTIEARYPGKTTPADHRAARAMSAYFVNFARTGTPNGVGLPDWPVYRDDVRPMMDFTANGPTPGADPWRERLDLAERVAESARDKSRK
ncbi:carboxylesterase family protein [Sphingomonas sp. HF-S3]|uniref:Carboxylic ester hydrolase n=1 Tax=Sphingomonas rustica TaxID=3103142 RepID=A0ABV0B740_9SPHN